MRERNELILGDLIEARAEQKPDFDVLTFERWSIRDRSLPDEIRTYADLRQNAHRIAAEIVRRRMEPGDRFGLMMRNHPEYVESMIAASITACACVPIDPRTRGEKLSYMLKHSQCRGLICADYCLEQVSEVREQIPGLDWVLSLETGEDPASIPASDVPGVEPLGAVLSAAACSVDNRLTSGEQPIQILYTSGTTGDPKGVVFGNIRFGMFMMISALLGYSPDDRPYTGLSLTHGNAQAVTLAPSLHAGFRAVFSRRFTKSRLWDVCRRYGCTTFSLLGGMATAIYAEPEREDDGQNPVRFVISAGMPAAIWEAFERRFNVQVFEWYGAVEGGLALKPIGMGPIGSFGKPAPGLDMKIVDEQGNERPPGEVGEIISRFGGGAEVEYFRDEKASKDKTRGGWLRSGDMGHTDEEGWFFFDYRKGGGLRRNGEFINPSFVEKTIAEHPRVSDVYVYGVPASSGAPGEKDLVAAVVPKDGEAFSPAEVFESCRKKLEPNAVPSYLQVVDEIPKTISEKPQERFLLDQFAPDAPNVHSEPQGS